MINQMDLVNAITKEIKRQKIKEMNSRQFNSIITAANNIIKEFNISDKPLKEGMTLTEWYESDYVGASSKFMAFILKCGRSCVINHPHDPSDFERCYLFLKTFPEAKKEMHRLKECSKVWSAMVDSWFEMERLYEEEKEYGKAPKLYALMQKIINEESK